MGKEKGYPGNVYRAIVDRAEFELVHEHANPVDSNAIFVRRADSHERLGYIEAIVAKVLVPHIDTGETWVIGEKHLSIKSGSGDSPTLHLTLERIEWMSDMELSTKPPARPQSPYERVAKRNAEPDRHVYAKRMTELGRGLVVRWVAGNQYAVSSVSEPDKFYSVVVEPDDHGLAMCFCHCRSGACRPNQPIPCRHAAAVVSLLVDSKYLRRIDGLAYRVG
jgi:hypothetical protein